MAGKEIDLGPTGKQVKENVARIRRARGLSFAELSRRLTEVERPIPPLGLRRIEEGLRRVDVDDLFALATVLWVTPSILMLPPTRGADDIVEATGVGEAPSYWLWSWATWQGAGGAGRVVWRIPEQVAHRLGYDSREGLDFVKSQAPRDVYARLEALENEALVAVVALNEAQRRLSDAEERGESEETIADLRGAADAASVAHGVARAMLSVEREKVESLRREPTGDFFPYLAPDDAP